MELWKDANWSGVENCTKSGVQITFVLTLEAKTPNGPKWKVYKTKPRVMKVRELEYR